MRTLLCAAILAAAGAAGAEDGLRRPRQGTAVSRDGDETVIEGAFGRIRVSSGALAETAGVDRSEPGIPRAETRGVFHLTYALARENGAAVVRRARVTVDARVLYHAAPTPRLREHEAVHLDINRRAAGRIEETLGKLRWPGLGLRGAEARLKARFNEEVDAVRRLHAEWDETHVFLSTGGSGTP